MKTRLITKTRIYKLSIEIRDTNYKLQLTKHMLRTLKTQSQPPPLEVFNMYATAHNTKNLASLPIINIFIFLRNGRKKKPFMGSV